MVKEKLHIEELMEKAEDWWYSELPASDREDIMLDAYMKAKKIKKSDVDYYRR